MTDGVCWIALGLAMVSKEFADALYLRVGPNAFDGLARVCYDLIELEDVPAIRRALGLSADGKLSGAVLKYLEREANERWRFKTRRDSRSKELTKIIEDATMELAHLARSYEYREESRQEKLNGKPVVNGKVKR